MNKDVIIQKATQVRKWAESLQSTHHVWRDDMRGLCAIASYKLKQELDEIGVPNVEIGVHEQSLGGCHCYVLIANKTIVDVTATQFGKRRSRIEIRDVDGARRVLGWWKPTQVYSTLDSFAEYCSGWYIHQQPLYVERLGEVL